MLDLSPPSLDFVTWVSTLKRRQAGLCTRRVLNAGYGLFSQRCSPRPKCLLASCTRPLGIPSHPWTRSLNLLECRHCHYVCYGLLSTLGRVCTIHSLSCRSHAKTLLYTGRGFGEISSSTKRVRPLTSRGRTTLASILWHCICS